MSCFAKVLSLSLTVFSAISLAASTMTPFNHQSGIIAPLRLGLVPIRVELLEPEGASTMRLWFETGQERVRIPEVALFSGSFAGPITWTSTTLSNGTQRYTVAGVLISRGARPLDRARVQMISNSERSLSAALTAVTSRYFHIGSVPEPSMMVLVVTGLLGVLTKARRSFS